MSLLRSLGLAFSVALLPSPERDRLSREWGIDAPRCSFLFGLVQGFIGVGLYLANGLAYMRGSSLTASLGLLNNWVPGLSTEHIRATGLVSWLGWLIHPLSWPLAYLALVGLARTVAFAAAREPMGEPLVIAVLRLSQKLSRGRRERRRLAELGPVRPDRLIRGDGEWWVITCREKEEWTEAATIEIEGCHFRVAGVEDREYDDWKSVAYRLRPDPDNAIIRRLVRYVPPSGFESPHEGE